MKRANPDKCYLIDTGLIAALKPKNDAEKGWLLENAVLLAVHAMRALDLTHQSY